MSFFFRLVSLARSLSFVQIALVAALALGGASFLYVQSGRSTGTTLVAHSGLFTEQVSVSGKVVAVSTVDLGFDESGRVAKIYAKVGDTVASGTLLASVENGDLSAALREKEAALDVQKAKLASLKEGTRPEQLAITETAVSNDRSALDEANRAVVNAVKDAYTKSDDAVRGKLDQFITNPTDISIKLSFYTSDNQLSSRITNGRLSVEGTLRAWKRSLDALSSSSDVTASAREAEDALAQVRALLEDVSLALNNPQTITVQTGATGASQPIPSSWKTDISTARANVNGAISALTSAETTQKSAISDLERDQKNLALEQAGSTQSDIDAQEAQVASAEADMENAAAQLHKTLVVAPFPGIVTKMDAKEGEIVSPNTSLISMISTGVFRIETFIPEIDIAGVALGNLAQVTLDAYGDASFPANVVLIDPAETVRDGVSTYKVTLQFSEKDPRIRSGMTANTIITIAEKHDVIVVPRSALFERDGQKYVRVKEGRAVFERAVETGGESLGRVEIVTGLKDGDVVLLIPGV